MELLIAKRKSEKKKSTENSQACDHFYLHTSSCLSENPNNVGSPQKTGCLQGSNTEADKT